MSQAFFDALHVAKVRMAERDPVECPECGGTGVTDCDCSPCIYCAGKGYWLGAI